MATVGFRKPVASVGVWLPGLNGLVEGVGRDVFGINGDCALSPFSPAVGENLEGNVPARVRLREPDNPAASTGTSASKAGKLSPVGDSGMVSRNGVELPLVGGPHTWGATPSCACISRALHLG